VLTLLLACVLAVSSLSYAFRTLVSCGRASRSLASLVEDDPLEQRLAEKELRLLIGLGRRSVLALGRASLFGGTGLGVWALTGGSAHYLEAAASFGLGLLSWAGCGEAQRRIGSLADRPRSAGRRQGVDQPERTG
jgi:hypothetical protein